MTSYSCNWLYHVFPSFGGKDVRKTFLSHLLSTFGRKLIIAFKDNEMERSQPISPKLKEAIRYSRIAVVVFSKNYASSGWCLDELLEIVKCEKECGQILIPIFYGLDPCHVRYQSGEFGDAFEKTCKRKTDHEIKLWRDALTYVGNILGFHSLNWDDEAKMIEAIADDVLGKLNSNPSNGFGDFVGIEDHIEAISLLLRLESEEVKMVGIWGPSGIGKSVIARALFSRVSPHFQGKIFIDRAFISKSMEIYGRANPDDINKKLHLQGKFLSEILGKGDMKIEHLGAVQDMLKHQKILILIDDLDDQVILDSLAGQTQWFGSGSRIIAVTTDKRLLRAHGIDCIYKVGLPSRERALKIFCQSAFRQNSPPQGFMGLASQVAHRTGNLPLGLNILGSNMRGRDKQDWIDMMPRLRHLDGKIEKTLMIGYDGLDSKNDKAIFRHLACLFSNAHINYIKLLLADSDLDVNIGLKNLVDKSLIHEDLDIVKMHCLVQEMGRVIVNTQSDEPGEREFLTDGKDICGVLNDGSGTKKVLGISLDLDTIEELDVHERAFKGMSNLFFLIIYAKPWMLDEGEIFHLPEGFNYLPSKLRLLSWDKCPMRSLANFCPKNLIKIRMWYSKLEKLWEGVQPLKFLRVLNLWGSRDLTEIPDLSKAINLEKFYLGDCSSLVEIPSSIRNLNKLTTLNMKGCTKLKTLPTGINLKSLSHVDLRGCPQLRSFPVISTNISELYLDQTAIEEIPSKLRLENLVDLHIQGIRRAKLWTGMQPLTTLFALVSPSLTVMSLSDVPSVVEFPSSLRNLSKLVDLRITNCKNLETLPTGINLESLDRLELTGCSQLKSFPDISSNVSFLFLARTAIQEVPWWIGNFSGLKYLSMEACKMLKYISPNISKLKHLEKADFSNCTELAKPRWQGHDCPSEVAIETSTSLENNCRQLMGQEALVQQQSVFKLLILPGREVPSYFPHQATGSSLTNIPLHHSSLSQQFFKFRACVVVKSMPTRESLINIQVFCCFRGGLRTNFDSGDQLSTSKKLKKAGHLNIFDCSFRLKKDDDRLAELSYIHVDVEFRIIHKSQCQIKGCGVRISEPNLLQHACEAYERTLDNDGS